jgi:hypothetical protein
MAFFALGDSLLYYSAEIKPYSIDVALALTALLLAVRDPASATARDESKSAAIAWRNRLGLLALGVVGVWFSFPLIFVLAGIGMVRFLEAASRRDSRDLAAWSATGLAWLASFGVCYLISQAIVRKGKFLLDWWDYAFLPLPPTSWQDLNRIFIQTVNLLIHPGDLWTPIGLLVGDLRSPLGLFATAYLGLGLVILGILGVERRQRGVAWLLLSPMPLVMVASSLQEYPFHGRVVLFLIPSLYVLLGDGMARLGGSSRGAALLRTLLLVSFLIRPVWDTIWYHNIIARAREFNAHGDLRPDLLDFMEFEGAPPDREPATPNPSLPTPPSPH